VSPDKINGRQLKRNVLKLLQQENPDRCISELSRLPARKVVNPLFSFLCSPDELVKWRAVSAMGAVLANLAETNLESARVVMRRFIWQLNDESGGIGWGCPEAMGDTMARSKQLAEEYGGILISYIRPNGNYLEHEMLQRGALWGVGRLAHRRPDLFTGCAPLLIPYMQSNDAALRGLAVWAAVALADKSIISLLRKLSGDGSRFSFYHDWQLDECAVGQIARDAIKAAES
jgi:HEAT repeat protein